MNGMYACLTKEETVKAFSDPEILEEIIDNDGEERGSLDIGKSWHGIHFVLNGDPWKGNPPLSNVVLGGKEVGEDLGYGAPRLLKPEEVKEVATALEKINEKEFSDLFKQRKFAGADIYVYSQHAGDEDILGELCMYYMEVKQFFKEAADGGKGILLYLI
jgi:hypothetical protein